MTHHRHYSKSEEEFISLNYRIYGGRYCAERLDRDHSCVCQKAARMGIFLSKEERRRLAIKARERSDEWYDVNPSLFRNVTMPEVAYLLGYLWADGHIYAYPSDGSSRSSVGNYIFNLEIGHADYLSIKSSLDRIGKWKVYIRTRKNRARQSVANIKTGNKSLVVYLADNGYQTKSKDSPLKILSTIPDHLKHYFWRGYMDGDGCFFIGKRSSSFCMAGSFDQDWSAHASLLDWLGIKYKIDRRVDESSKSSSLRCQYLDGVFKLGEYLYRGYKDDGIGLPRKYNKWLQARDKHNTSHAINDLRVEAPRDLLVLPSVLLFLIGKYSGVLTRRAIFDACDIEPHRFNIMLRSLTTSGLITISGYTSKRIYSITDDGLNAIEKFRQSIRPFVL